MILELINQLVVCKKIYENTQVFKIFNDGLMLGEADQLKNPWIHT